MKTLSMMTEKMNMLYVIIVEFLEQLPIEQKGYIFSYEVKEDYNWLFSVVDHIVLEFIKYSYDFSDPEYSLRHFLNDPDDDSERMREQRTMQYVMKYKKREIEYKGINLSADDKYANINMNSIDHKLKGYSITKMNYYEHQNIHDLEIIKAISERRIVSSKKISNSRFKEMFDQYDGFVESLIARSKLSDNDMVFASLALFTFEWHYPVEMFYYLSCIMEENKTDTVDRDALILLCGSVNIDARSGGRFSTDSRMIKGRLRLSSLLFAGDSDESVRKTAKELIKEILVLVIKTKELWTGNNGKLCKDLFRENSTMADWASFFRYYDVFSIWQKKTWTLKRIQNMRHLFDLSLRKNENPENRS